MAILEEESRKSSLFNEISGAFGDLGTFLPHVLGAISVAGLNPASIFTGFGLFYLFSGWFYRLPMAVQPMKAASAAVLVQKLSAGEVAAAGILMGVILLFLGFSGLIDKLSKITPAGVIGGIQMGLGLSLAVLGIKMVKSDPYLGAFLLVTMLPLLGSRKFPAALYAIAAGTLIRFFTGADLVLPTISLHLSLPTIVWPAWTDFQSSFFLVVLPQLPLTLANAVLVTTVVSRELYGDQASRVTDRNLSLTMGFGNLLAAPFGGYAMCHGSGGVTAHYRFGGRTRLTAYIIGFLLLFTGLLLGKDGALLLALIPGSALGCLLFYSGLDLALAARRNSSRDDFYLVLFVASLALAVNPAVAFLAGFILSKGLEMKLIKI